MMPPPRTHRLRLTLAAVDFSRPSAKAVRYAVAIAHAAGGRVAVMHALDPLLTAAAARAYAERTLVTETRVELEKFVRRAVGENAAADIEYVVAIGPPRQVIVEQSRRLHADIVVVGTHGRGGVSKAFFGSVTEALLRRHQGPVMVVPPGCPNPPASWPGPSALAAVGHGSHRRAMMAAAARAAELFGAWLSVVDTEAPVPRSKWHEAALVLLPLAAEARLRTFRQGTAAYGFVRHARRPVLVIHTGRRIGHADSPRRAA